MRLERKFGSSQSVTVCIDYIKKGVGVGRNFKARS